MTQFKRVLLLTAAVVLAVSSAEANGRYQQPTLKLPAATAARGQALSPSAINRKLAAKRYRVQEMYRNGSAYQVKAVGPSGSKVEMMVDGRSGAILGLNVLSGLAAIANAVFGPNHHMHTAYVDDRTPFGAVVPSVVYSKWKPYSPRDWNTGSDYIPVEQGYAPYGYAVPYTYVHTSPQGRSYAVAPPSYRGYALQDSSGRAIQAAQTQADAADMRAALASERASDADYRAALSAQDARDANQNAADMARIADAQQNRADAAEAENQRLQAQLDSAGTADRAVSRAEADSAVSDNAAPPSADEYAPEDTAATDNLDDYQGGGILDGRDDQRVDDTGNQGGDDQKADDNNNQGSDDQKADDNSNQGGDDQNAGDNNNQGGGDQNSNDGNDQNANDGGQGNNDQGTNDGDQGGNDQGSGDDHGDNGEGGDDNN